MPGNCHKWQLRFPVGRTWLLSLQKGALELTENQVLTA
jgi:hypothetical protein